jgi:hypothetical protein
MADAHALPNDLAERHQLLLAAFPAGSRRIVKATLSTAEGVGTPVAGALDGRHARDRIDGRPKRKSPGTLWAYIGEQYPYSVYDFTESRARDGPAQFLAGFHGYLHADAYGGYDHLYLRSNNAIREVACWAHVRRRFLDTRDS